MAKNLRVYGHVLCPLLDAFELPAFNQRGREVKQGPAASGVSG